MGWSLPNIPIKEEVSAWSPWICLTIIASGIFVAFIHIVVHSPAGEFPTLASGYWLPLTGYTLAGIMSGITLYLIWWEIRTFLIRNWNNWRLNTHLAWRHQSHQHLCVANHTVLTADTQLLSKLAGVAQINQDEVPSLTLSMGTPLIPGIIRFEQICKLLINNVNNSLAQQYSSGPLTILIQTTAYNNEKEEESLKRLWEEEKLPWIPFIHVLPDGAPFEGWNQRLLTTSSPVLVLVMHYRQPDETLPEFACALLLLPQSMVKPSEQRDAVRVFRTMPLNTGALPRELAELRDMEQQPAGEKFLVWHSGLSASSARALGRVVNELPLPLHNDIAAGGIIDFEKTCADYKALAGWLMVAAATEMVNYGPGSHWLIQANGKQASVMVVGNGLPVNRDNAIKVSPLPYPSGSLSLAIILNVAVFGSVYHFSPDWLFSLSGMLCVMLSMVFTLPGAVFLLRHVLTSLQRPRFVQAAGLDSKE